MTFVTIVVYTQSYIFYFIYQSMSYPPNQQKRISGIIDLAEQDELDTVEAEVDDLQDGEITGNMLQINTDNTADTEDMGVAMKFVNAGTKYSGLFRDATDGKMLLLKDQSDLSSLTITTMADLKSGDSEVSSLGIGGTPSATYKLKLQDDNQLITCTDGNSVNVFDLTSLGSGQAFLTLGETTATASTLRLKASSSDSSELQYYDGAIAGRVKYDHSTNRLSLHANGSANPTIDIDGAYIEYAPYVHAWQNTYRYSSTNTYTNNFRVNFPLTKPSGDYIVANVDVYLLTGSDGGTGVDSRFLSCWRNILSSNVDFYISRGVYYKEHILVSYAATDATSGTIQVLCQPDHTTDAQNTIEVVIRLSDNLAEVDKDGVTVTDIGSKSNTSLMVGLGNGREFTISGRIAASSDKLLDIGSTSYRWRDTFGETFNSDSSGSGSNHFDARNTHASYAGEMVRVRADRAATTSYSFFEGHSNVASSSDTEFNLQGNGTGLCDGSWTGGGADYAEYFEIKDGENALNYGDTVVLDTDRIRLYDPLQGDDLTDIIGVVRPKVDGRIASIV